MHRIGLRIVLALSLAGALLACRDSFPYTGAAQDTDLRSIIKNQIRSHVRESYGEYAGQNFSSDDLDRFTAQKIPDQIVAGLRSSKLFLAAVGKVRQLSPSDRAAYLEECRKPLRPTWAEQGKIDRNGTTEAGRQAELMIANAITDLAESMLADSGSPPAK
jgi:hypothetical protein